MTRRGFKTLSLSGQYLHLFTFPAIAIPSQTYLGFIYNSQNVFWAAQFQTLGFRASEQDFASIIFKQCLKQCFCTGGKKNLIMA